MMTGELRDSIFSLKHYRYVQKIATATVLQTNKTSKVTRVTLL